jgi:hypothetical protein
MGDAFVRQARDALDVLDEVSETPPDDFADLRVAARRVRLQLVM